MKYSTILVGGLASIVTAHSVARDASVPQLVGGRKFLSELAARNALPKSAAPVKVQERHTVEERQNANGRCGADFNKVKCTAGCCSPAGYCGTTSEYCAAPDCQLAYGPGCDGNTVPSGTSTSSIARTKSGSVPYGGAGIYDCTIAGDIALTFDDGPYLYTSDLLNKLKAYNAKATFFITGNNLGKGPIDSTAQWSNLIKRMVVEGHQIASHTWSHQNLSSLDATTFQNQIVYNEMAFRNILGYFPTYMRPPYSECSGQCPQRLGDLGYHVTYFDLDTAGYLNPTTTLIQNSKNIWDAAINPSNKANDAFLQIEHDIQYQTVYNLTDYILASLNSHGYKAVTVGDCLADPQANWYRAAGSTVPTGTTPSTPTATGKTVSTEGNCGGSVTCQGSVFGNCCSQYSYCGSTADYCGTGCQSGFGTCTGSGSTAMRPVISTSKPSSKLSTPSKPTSTFKSNSSSTKPTSTTPAQSISTDGSCSSTVTCKGSTFGNCCSQYSYCGSTSAYCGTGCKPASGTCS
ncbi:carbohydrate esterase family 4 protein [Amylocarpus encephaloides]|uniref:Carbohydrate esterase family 4 protein n=1 Tax=Amylocarpus encephaloides TaxID=45428 RepID=A0A9P7YTY0_9HELO|nr:carbohydrate esterase family 4 protein [Amylocarpus encephaloides]